MILKRPIFDRYDLRSMVVIGIIIVGFTLLATWLAQPHYRVVVSSLTVETK